MKRLIFIFAALLIVSSGLVTAQEQTGILVGTVMDTDGAFLPGVTIEARSPSQPGVATAITDEVGRFRLIGLSPGTYQVTFRLPGFQTLIREKILVRLGRTFSLEVTISQATMEEEVTVIGESPVVDIKKSGTTTNYGKEMIAKLPKGRDFTSVVNMTAGVNDENVGGGTMMDGASSSENMYFVDGMDTTSMYTGTSSQRVLMEFVEEVQVKSSGYEAEHGGSMGGVINVITRSGGNEFHGEVSGY
ncbi:MAG: TonB-dependent receptor, partial [Candidatus Aminicenantaceae bacterium]